MAKIKNLFKKIDAEELITKARADEKTVVHAEVTLYSSKEKRDAFKNRFGTSITDKGVGVLTNDTFVDIQTGKSFREKHLVYLQAILFIDIRPKNLLQRILYGTRRVCFGMGSDDFLSFCQNDFNCEVDEIITSPSFLYQDAKELDTSNLNKHKTHKLTLI
jgi:hypothetical protein